MPESVDSGAGVVCGALGRARVERLAAEELWPARVLVPLCAATSSRPHEVQVEAALVCNVVKLTPVT